MLRTSILPNVSGRPGGRSQSTHSQSSVSSWQCLKCTTWNDADNVNCTVCMKKKMEKRIDLEEEQRIAPQMGVVNPRLSVRLKALFSKTPPEWECPRCTYINGGYFTQCQSCRFLRLVDKKSRDHGSSVDKEVRVVKKKKGTSEEQSSSVFDSVKALFQRRSSESSPSKSSVAKKVTERGGEKEWQCQQCTLLNPDSLTKCSICDFRRDFGKGSASASSADDLLPAESDSPLQSTASSSHQNTQDDSSSITGPSVNHSDHREEETDFDHNDTATPLPPPPESPQRQREWESSLISSQGAPTWHCGVCGAYNVVMKSLRHCYICGIGVIPEGVLPITPTTHTPSGLEAGDLPVCDHKPTSQSRKQKQDFSPSATAFEESSEQDHVSVTRRGPHLVQNQEHNHIAHRQLHHPLTHTNHFEVSPSSSPPRNTSSNDRAFPQMEQQQLAHVNSQCAVGLGGHLQPNYLANGWDTSLEESCIDPYSRPRPPPDVQSHRLGLHVPPADQHGARHRRPHSDEGAKTDWMEEASFNRTKCVEETLYEDVLHANSLYQEIQWYSRQVCAGVCLCVDERVKVNISLDGYLCMQCSFTFTSS